MLFSFFIKYDYDSQHFFFFLCKVPSDFVVISGPYNSLLKSQFSLNPALRKCKRSVALLFGGSAFPVKVFQRFFGNVFLSTPVTFLRQYKQTNKPFTHKPLH